MFLGGAAKSPNIANCFKSLVLYSAAQSRAFGCADSGGVAEWLKAHAWKACLQETVTWVRIPLPPPTISIFFNVLWIEIGGLPAPGRGGHCGLPLSASAPALHCIMREAERKQPVRDRLRQNCYSPRGIIVNVMGVGAGWVSAIKRDLNGSTRLEIGNLAHDDGTGNEG